MISNKIAQIRQLMREYKIDAYLVPSADPHLSEYLPAHWQARVHLSDFTGSAGTLLITTHEAALWTDSRYWEQAEQQLANSEIILKKQSIDPEPADYLCSYLPENSVVAVEADMLSVAAQKRFQAAFSLKNIDLSTKWDLLSAVWQDRPALPQAAIFAHHADYIDETSSQKLARVRETMQQYGADYHLISSLDDIAWLTNLRGADVPYNPVFLSYLLISPTQAILFTDAHKLDENTHEILQAACIQLANYHDIAQHIGTLSGSLMIDSNKTAVATLSQLSENVKLIEQVNPSSLFKSQKSPAQIDHIRQAMREDGAALCGFFAELERDLAAGIVLNELDIETRLTAHRSQRPLYISPSFGTIAGFRENGALPHYSAHHAPQAKSLTGNGLLLIDSGAQYHNGTTDITRVISLGEANHAAKTDFTYVLKAHIALAQAVFPKHLSAAMVDTIARAPMWASQRDYGHGTGHGVGYCLNVHEFPATIAYRAAPNPHNILQVGQLVSNEPGLYRSGEYGIRIENLIVCQDVEKPNETAFGEFCYFETLTLCPIDTRLILNELLSDSERAWLNHYHAKVREQLLPLLTDEATKAWLMARTEAI